MVWEESLLSKVAGKETLDDYDFEWMLRSSLFQVYDQIFCSYYFGVSRLISLSRFEIQDMFKGCLIQNRK